MTLLEILIILLFFLLIGFAALAIKDRFNEGIVQQDMPFNKPELLEDIEDEDSCEELIKRCQDIYKFCRG